jgi:hypothetical protein
MCANHEPAEPEANQPFTPSPSAFLANLRQPGPLGWKLRRLWANNLTKITKHQNCCGNAGEPGC